MRVIATAALALAALVSFPACALAQTWAVNFGNPQNANGTIELTVQVTYTNSVGGPVSVPITTGKVAVTKDMGGAAKRALVEQALKDAIDAAEVGGEPLLVTGGISPGQAMQVAPNPTNNPPHFTNVQMKIVGQMDDRSNEKDEVIKPNEAPGIAECTLEGVIAGTVPGVPLEASIIGIVTDLGDMTVTLAAGMTHTQALSNLKAQLDAAGATTFMSPLGEEPVRLTVLLDAGGVVSKIGMRTSDGGVTTSLKVIIQ